MTQPFRVAVPQAALDDLARRLKSTRWPEASPREGWSQGTELAYLKDLVDYWRAGFDWRREEARLNSRVQFIAPVSGMTLHFIHERSPHPGARPLLLIHGWPGGIHEFHRLIPMLTRPEQHGGDPRDAFHVVAPSLPGYGYSDPFPGAGGNPRQFGRVFHSLMTETLGYSRYGAQGGDWGAVIASWMGMDHADSLPGIHLNMAGLRPNPPRDAVFTPEEQAYLAGIPAQRAEELGYMALQGSRPQTLAYALMDSPAGLAGWLVEKYRAWSDCGGDVERAISRDDLLTLITLYWVTGSIASSMRLYYEFRVSKDRLPPGGRVQCPTGFADFPKEFLRAPRAWVERAYNIVHWTPMPRGGHFAALEAPELLAADIRAFFRSAWR